MKRTWGLLLILLLGLTGCGGGGDSGYGSSSSSSSSSSSTSSSGGLEPNFASIQTNIFTPICTVCHTAGHTTGLDLREGNSYALLVGVNSSEVASLQRVAAGDPDNSYLIQKLEGTAAVGGRMPANGPPYLSADQIAIIRQWISDGAMEMSAGTNMNIMSVAAVSPADHAVVESAPDKITIVLNDNVDASLVYGETVLLLASGGDGSFNEGNESPVKTAFVDVSPDNPHLILIKTGESPLPADTYRVIVKGSGDVSIANIAGTILDGDGDGSAGGDFVTEFTVASR